MKERLILFDFTLWNLQNQAELSETEDFIEYLQQKHPAIRSEDLCFEPEGGYARSIVLYMLQEDFERPTSSPPKKKSRRFACLICEHLWDKSQSLQLERYICW